jgi:hypothetical protein
MHDGVGIAIRSQIRADDKPARLRVFTDQSRRRARHHLFLRDVPAGAVLDFARELGNLFAREVGTEHGIFSHRRISGLDHQLM